MICNKTEAIQLQLRGEEWSHDDDDEQGGLLFHKRLFFRFCSFPLAESASVYRLQTAGGHNSFNTHSDLIFNICS